MLPLYIPVIGVVVGFVMLCFGLFGSAVTWFVQSRYGTDHIDLGAATLWIFLAMTAAGALLLSFSIRVI